MFSGQKKDRKYNRLVFYNFLVSGASVVAIVLLFVLHLWIDYGNYRGRELDKLRVLTVSAASQTQGLLDSILITMKLLDEWIVNNPDRDPRFDPEFNRMVDVFRAHTGNSIDLRAVMEDGGLFYFPSVDSTPLANVTDREYYLAQKNGDPGGLYFAAPVLSRVTGKWGIPISYKLAKNRHNLLVLFAVAEYAVFDEMYKGIVENTNRSFTIVRDDFLVLQRTPYSEYVIGTHLDFKTQEGDYDIVVINNPEPMKRVLFKQKLRDFPVYIIIADDFAQITDDWLETVWPKTVVVLFVVIVLIVLSFRSFKLSEELNQTRKMLESAARFDELTKLKNRRYFFERANEEMDRAIRHGGRLVMLMVDIDFFKKVNDNFGHPVGDLVLIKMARNIDACVRSLDVLGRVGGEEFAILLTDTEMEKALEVAERIRVGALTVIERSWQGSVSIGVARWKGQPESLESLYKRADDALLTAKEQGRNRVVAATV